MRRASRRIAVLAGIGCLAVSVAALVFLDELGILYELHRIRGDEAYLLRALERPEGTHAREAARRYVESTEGQRALLGVFLESDESWLDEVDRRATIMVRWTSPDAYLLSWKNAKSQATVRPWKAPPPAFLSAAREHLFKVDERRIALPRYPGLVFRCVGVPRLRAICAVEKEVHPPPMALRPR
jgi:hypothetical protein